MPGLPGLSLFALCDAESSTIGCNAELNEIKIILISVLKHPINGLCCLRSGRLRGIHITCIELAFEPDGINFWNNWLKKRNQHVLFILNFSQIKCCKNEKR
jgi:hypothetical protein